MTYHDHYSPDPARHNQLDQRLGGILNFDNRNDWNQGQAALDYGSGPGIEFPVDGANFLINGSKVGAPSNTVSLSDGHDSLWRTDHIYASEDGAYNKLEGEPGSNEYLTHKIADTEMVTNPPGNVLEDTFEEGDVVHLRHENTQAGGPAPKGQQFDRKRGELIYSILVPPGATSIDEFSSQHILDRRREAIDLLNTGRPRTPAISSDYFELEENEWQLWQLPAWPDQTLRLWDYGLSQMQYGYFGSSSLHVYLVDWAQRTESRFDWNDGEPDWSSIAVWDSGDTRQRPDDDEEPLVDIDLSSSGVEPHAFVVENTSNQFRFVGNEGLALSVTYTIEDTDSL